MSSRVLKKLHGDADLNIHAEQTEDSDEPSDLEQDASGGVDGAGAVDRPKKINVNRYDLFNEQSMSESEVKEDDNETEHASTAAAHPGVEQAKKKKKKRKKKATKQAGGGGAGGVRGQRRSSEDKSDMDEIIRTLREIGSSGKGGHHASTTASSQQLAGAPNAALKQLLAVQHKHLSASYEMKRMFGSRVVQQAADQNRTRRNHHQRGPVRTLKSTWLIQPKDNWPPVTKTGLYMSVEPEEKSATATDGQSDGNRNASLLRQAIWFRIEHNATYRQLQERFLTAVESADSDNIIAVINQQPYHVDSLIQLSELCKMSEDHAMAAELIEHAIFSLESAFHTLFSLTAGNCRLDYRRQENRALFVTLFKHAQYLEGRACARTALEVAKLMLSFDPERDPLAMVLCVDYYALRACQYEWLVQLYEQWDAAKNLAQLPNMAYSYAMALFYLHGPADTQLADAALQYALLMFPGVLRALLAELGVQTDARAQQHAFFGAAAAAAQRPALQQLCTLYTVRTRIVWQDAGLLPWMERNVAAVLDRVDAGDALVAEYAAKRAVRYALPPRSILRHIVLSDFKERVPLEPFINKDSEPILMYDPLPPLDSINIYTRPSTSRAGGASGAANRALAEASPFSMFFQSLLPTFNVQGNAAGVQQQAAAAAGPAAAAGAVGGAAAVAAVAAPAAAAAAAVAPQALAGVLPDGAAVDAAIGAAVEGAVVDGQQSFVELRQSLTSIVDAMRDFLTNVRVPERPNDADVDENESSSDDDEGGQNDYLT